MKVILYTILFFSIGAAILLGLGREAALHPRAANYAAAGLAGLIVVVLLLLMSWVLAQAAASRWD